MVVWLVVLWSCSRLEVLGKGNIFQSTAGGQNVSGKWTGLSRQGFGKPLLVLGGIQNAEVLENHGGSSQLLLLWGGLDGCLMLWVQQ